MTSYREMEKIDHVKSKVLNHLSHELRTPLAIIKGKVVTICASSKSGNIDSFDRGMQRIARHLHSLNTLEAQVESIVMTWYMWELRHITGFLQSALEMMDLQAEYTPEIKEAVTVIHQWLDKTFPTRKDTPERINARNSATRC